MFTYCDHLCLADPYIECNPDANPVLEPLAESVTINDAERDALPISHGLDYTYPNANPIPDFLALAYAEPIAVRLSNTLAKRLGNSVTGSNSVGLRDTIANRDALAVTVSWRNAQRTACIRILCRREWPRKSLGCLRRWRGRLLRVGRL